MAPPPVLHRAPWSSYAWLAAHPAAWFASLLGTVGVLWSYGNGLIWLLALAHVAWTVGVMWWIPRPGSRPHLDDRVTPTIDGLSVHVSRRERAAGWITHGLLSAVPTWLGAFVPLAAASTWVWVLTPAPSLLALGCMIPYIALFTLAIALMAVALGTGVGLVFATRPVDVRLEGHVLSTAHQRILVDDDATVEVVGNRLTVRTQDGCARIEGPHATLAGLADRLRSLPALSGGEDDVPEALRRVHRPPRQRT